jgi:hypothetical protein
MNTIETIAPISIETLKKYFENKSVEFILDYTNSKIKSTKLLTYLSNLDIPCDIKVSTIEEKQELLKDYLHSSMLCNIPLLEIETINLLLVYKGIIEDTDNVYEKFIQDNEEIILSWVSKLDSLILYNVHIFDVEEFKNYIKEFPLDDTKNVIGINFVSLLKHEYFYVYYDIVFEEGLKFYKSYFEEYMFKGQNLYAYWATAANPMFLLSFGISEGLDYNIENNQTQTEGA